ncbi:hypothetical protein ACFL18_02545 [Patescibacteria group bacterium]
MGCLNLEVDSKSRLNCENFGGQLYHHAQLKSVLELKKNKKIVATCTLSGEDLHVDLHVSQAAVDAYIDSKKPTLERIFKIWGSYP